MRGRGTDRLPWLPCQRCGRGRGDRNSDVFDRELHLCARCDRQFVIKWRWMVDDGASQEEQRAWFERWMEGSD